MITYLLGSNTSTDSLSYNRTDGLTTVQFFTAYIFTVKYNVLFGL